MVTAAVPPAVPALQQQQPQQQRGCHAGFTHLDAAGRLPTMVDVGDKAVTTRTARARSKVILPRDVLHALVGSESNQGDGGTITELSGPKVRAVVVARAFGDDAVCSTQGPIFATAVIAGVMAAKKTSELIPFCHPLPIDKCGIDVRRGALSCCCGGCSRFPLGGADSRRR